MSEHPKLIYEGTLTANGYVEIGGADDIIHSVMCEWDDAVASGTFSIETTNKPRKLAAITSTSLRDWVPESGVVFEGAAPAGTAAGAQMCHLGNNGARRTRLKFTHAANINLKVWVHGKKRGG